MTRTLPIDVYPMTLLSLADDGPPKRVHVLRCKNQPPCKTELHISAGHDRPLPTNAVVKRAHQKGWLADRRGYCLCPEHTPWAKRKGEPSDLPPAQRRAAYAAIRERHLAAVNDREPVKERNMDYAEGPGVEVLAAARADPRIAKLRFDAPRKTLAVLEALLPAIASGNMGKGWRNRVGDSIGMEQKDFSTTVHRLIKLGYLVPVPGTFKLIVRKQPTKENAPMIDPLTAPSGDLEIAIEATKAAAAATAEPPRQPTLADNRRIRDFIDSNYDEAAARWCGDLSDAKAADRLKVPRAWVASVRGAFYGEDVNEAQVERIAVAGELAAAAAKLQEDALAIAERAEALERQARALLAQ